MITLYSVEKDRNRNFEDFSLQAVWLRRLRLRGHRGQERTVVATEIAEGKTARDEGPAFSLTAAPPMELFV